MGTEGKHEGEKSNITLKKGKKKGKIKWSRKKNKGLQWEEEQIKKLQAAYQSIDVSKIQSFSNFPLSQKTLKGLKDSGYFKPTEIQRECIGLALQGADILGAAKTGSGKTLAFLIPVIEILYCKLWTRMDGLGALIITPTRELAYQIFETLRKVGRYHDISGGLIIGGKDLHFEKKRMDQCNVVICTPGRLLQHMDENPLFDCSNMQILVLDEADRCLDMGFEATMNGIIENLPPKRQTLLFSATQTKSVRDLARLSLKDPMYVSVHEHAKHSTPESLQQSYIVCELHEKMDMLWSFIRNHLKQKILIFMSSCKQVKYHYEVFCRLRPGTSLLALYGTLHQMRRMAIYESFCRKSNAVLFATDIAARGLDFPEVNWVVQMDCPEDANTYIHRAGRTARYHKGGESLLVLLPSEESGMLEQLNAKKIPINKIKINPKKLQSPRRKIEALLARDPNLKESAQRAFVSYVKAVFLMKNKDVFDVHALNTDEYSRSLGLAVPPRIRFLQKLQKQQQNTESQHSQEEEEAAVADADANSDDDNSAEESNVNFHHGQDESDSELDILKVKRRDHELEDEFPPPEEDGELEDDGNKKKKKKVLTKVAVAKKILKKKIIPNKKVVFNEEGEMVVDPAKEKASSLAREYETENAGGIDIEKAKQVLREEDKFDKLRFREKVKAKHREEKLKLKKAKEELKKKSEEEEEEEDVEVRLGSEESSEENGPDLSWLPDPDKVYGEKASSSDEEEQVHRPLPLKRKLSKDSELRRKKYKQQEEESDDDAPLDTGLSLNEDEELALQFLKNR